MLNASSGGFSTIYLTSLVKVTAADNGILGGQDKLVCSLQIDALVGYVVQEVLHCVTSGKRWGSR